MNIEQIYKTHKETFNAQVTKNVEKRKQVLAKILSYLEDHEDDINAALLKDLGKQRAEAYLSEIGMIYDTMSYLEKNIDKWTKPRKVGSTIKSFYFKISVVYEPYGNVLVMAPWNYPFLLTMEPAVNAIAAGNTVVVKPSEYAEETTKFLLNMADEVDEPGIFSVVGGDSRVARELLMHKWDYIFFTGSQNVGKVVYKRAANFLTPVTLELGGKSPTIVSNDAELSLAAKRIAFGKFLNAGQTCVAPDYVFVHKDVYAEFINLLSQNIKEFFGEHPLDSEELCHIINRKHFNRLMSLAEGQHFILGGNANERTLKFEPTLIEGAKAEDRIMQEEIFGPLLPILPYTNIDDVISYINDHPKPLALYLFSESKELQDHVMSACSFGGGCINDTIIHLTEKELPFGGVGESGIGHYHGFYSFETFSHAKSILNSSTRRDITWRYYPLDEDKEYTIRKQFK